METKQRNFEHLQNILATDLNNIQREIIYLRDKAIDDFEESELDKIIRDVDYKIYQEGKNLQVAMNPERALEYLSYHTDMAQEDIKNVMHKATKGIHEAKDNISEDEDNYLSLMLMDNLLQEPYIWIDVLEEYKVRNKD